MISDRGLKWILLAGAILCVFLGVAFYPPLLAQGTWDGRIESLPGAIMLWIVLSILLFSTGLGLAVTYVAWLRRSTGGIWRHRGRIGARIVFSSSLIAAALGICFGGYYHRRNHVDLLERLNQGHPFSTEVNRVAAESGRRAAMDHIAEHFQSRDALRPIIPDQLWVSSEEIRRRSREVLEGKLTSSPLFRWKPGERIDWRCGARSERGVLLLELQGQRFLFPLLGAPEDVSESRRIEFAKAYVKEWRRANRAWLNPNRYAWNDDATSNRIQGHMYLMERARRLGMSSREEELAFLQSLLQHADRLMDPSEYNARTNHGLMQNCALLSIALAYPEFDRKGLWRQTAIRRMEEYLLRYAVTDSGVFLELTPEYHFCATLKALWFYASSRKADIELDRGFEPLVKKMVRFCLEILEPDRTFPMIADTRGKAVNVSGFPWRDLPDWEELSALRSALEPSQGPPNSPCAVLFPQSGYFVLRAPAPEWTTASAMMFTLKAGPRSHAHIHRDALSITLFANGRPLLVGPGYPPYDRKRSRIIGTTSQNTVSVDDKSQRAGGAQVVFTDLRCIGERTGGTPDFAAIQGRSLLYEGVRHDRTVLYGPSTHTVLIVDDLFSKNRHTYRQHFRFAHGLYAKPAPGLLTVARSQPNGAGLLLRILAWELGDSGPQRPGCAVNGQVGEFLSQAPSATFVSLLDFSDNPESNSLVVCNESLLWKGDRGALSVKLPIVSRQSYRWFPELRSEQR